MLNVSVRKLMMLNVMQLKLKRTPKGKDRKQKMPNVPQLKLKRTPKGRDKKQKRLNVPQLKPKKTPKGKDRKQKMQQKLKKLLKLWQKRSVLKPNKPKGMQVKLQRMPNARELKQMKLNAPELQQPNSLKRKDWKLNKRKMKLS